MSYRARLDFWGLVVSALLALQVILFWLNLSGRLLEISIFCTGPASGALPWVFGLLHISFLVLFVTGAASLEWRSVRPVYLILILVGLAALPMQAMLVQSHVLKCDLP